MADRPAYEEFLDRSQQVLAEHEATSREALNVVRGEN